MKRFRFFLLISLLVSATVYAESDMVLLFQDLKVLEEINQEIHDRLPFYYNATLMGGYFNMPSARMNDAGMAALGFAYVPPYRNYAATIQLLDRVELGVNYRVYIGTPEPTMGFMGFGDYSDRGANLKLGVLRPQDGFAFFPEIAVGFEDFYGSKRFHAFYAVVTKSFLDWNLEATLGWGSGRIKGFFGGLSFSPFRKTKWPILKDVSLIAEYDAIDYENHAWEHQDGKEVATRINVGVAATLFNCLQVNVNSLRGKKVAAFASLRFDLGSAKGLFPKVDNPPLYTTPINEEPIGLLRSKKELAQELAFAFSEQGLNLYCVYLCTDAKEGPTLWLKMINVRYRQEQDLKERIQAILASLVPTNIKMSVVVVEADGILTHEYRFRTLDLHRLREKTVGDFEFQTLSSMREPTPPPSKYDGSLIYHRNKKIWTFTVRPRLLSFFGSSTGKFKYSAGFVFGPEGYLLDEVYYKIQGAYNVKSSLADVGSRDLLNPSYLLQVRSDAVRYYQTNSVSLEEAYLQKGKYIKKGWYGRVSLGYFEAAYGGVTTEFLYYPVGSCWAVGIEGGVFLKRHYEGIKLQTFTHKYNGVTNQKVHFIGYQYFLDLYYDFRPLQLDFKISIGKFLARDVGARFEVGRYFASGVHFSVWYTCTNANDIVNGSRYRDKGFAFVIPFDFFLKKSSRTLLPYALSVWLRDQGASAATGKRLYPTLHDERETYLNQSRL